MKKITILLILCLFAVEMVSAQRGEVRRANRNLNRGNLETALEHIQNATKNESTKDDPGTWVLKTQIYMEIASAEDPAARNIVNQPLVKAHEAIKKAEELDVENRNVLEIQQTLLVLSELFFNVGAIAYNDNEFELAANYFLSSYRVSEGFGSVDTATLYNAGLAAEIGGLFEKAIDIYEQVEAMEYDQPYLYSSMAAIYNQKEETEKAEAIIARGRERYPESLELIFAEANLYLTTGNIPEARRILEIAIERDPENANLHYAFAVNYDQMSRDTLFTDEEREFAYNEAIEAYERAIELQPDYFDAVYNLGALLFNEGISLFVEAEEQLRKDMNFREYEKREEKVKEQWLKSQPYLERAFEMTDEEDPNYEIVLRSLRELYMRTDQNEKLEETNEIWKEKFGSPEEDEEMMFE